MTINMNKNTSDYVRDKYSGKINKKCYNIIHAKIKGLKLSN